ncbi:MAG: hypothetical protein ACP5N1_03025 [Candidatus Woesearchaeota archaeon]
MHMGYSSIIHIGGKSSDITLRIFDAYVKPGLEKNGLIIGDMALAKYQAELYTGVVTTISTKEGSVDNLDNILTNVLRDAAANALEIIMGKATPPIVNGKTISDVNPNTFIDIPNGVSIKYFIPTGPGSYEILAMYKDEMDAQYAFKHVHRNLFGIKKRTRRKK